MPIRHELPERQSIGAGTEYEPMLLLVALRGFTRRGDHGHPNPEYPGGDRSRGAALVGRADIRRGSLRCAIRNGSLSDVVQRGGAAALRPGHAVPAFVLVS